MILAEPSTPANGKAARVTLDDMFRRAVARRPAAIALFDPEDRTSFTDGQPRALTFTEADRIVTAIAGRLRRMGLGTDSIIGIQLPNTVESVLTLLGVLRAGMIAAPLPLLWRRADAVAALGRVNAKALITCARVGGTDHGDLGMHVAAEIFAMRYVGAFGRTLPDGIVPFDDLLIEMRPDPLPAPEGDRGNPAAHVAVITFEVTPQGMVPVARSHNELLASGLAVVMEGRFDTDSVILGAVPVSSFAGISLTVLSWLLVGGTLALHQPFNARALTAQIRGRKCRSVVLPGPLVTRLADAGLLKAADGLACILALWRAPERLPTAAPWRDAEVALIDVPAFGESALFAGRRGTDGKPLPIPLGRLGAPRGVAGAVPVLEIARTAAGTVAVRGPMVPRRAFPAGAENGELPFYKIGEDGLVDTGYTCRAEADGKTLMVTGAPAGIVSVGGYRFVLDEINAQVHEADEGASLAALPDGLSGHRLAGSAPDRERLQRLLAERGANPLVVGAFRERRPRGEAASAA